ncbi:hypothetical protein MKP08_08480 [Erythrobacter sp. LQ02-29]|uniref:hypothetical protein n=1 Tax=Erythrobacter sp. LQ02-29 TaxID=2920384 RepID=UPI001F4DC786|nr:hypothetical protein [Erythrobacter sp. LQ02-29]MCP9222780.1 hypothetical protein [Erythrobacter sp. LQ02-29]
MTFTKTTTALAGFAAVATLGTAANAQMMSEGQAKPQAQPAAPAADAGPVSAEEVTKFAKVVMGIQQMQGENPDMQPQAQQQAIMVLLQENDLAPARFQQIAVASRSDTELQTRIATALSKMSQADG